jgi:GT2 family glycosyltransferase
LVRHVPWLLAGDHVEPARSLLVEDELRWARFRSGRFWMSWALWRMVATGRIGLRQVLDAARRAGEDSKSADPPPFIRTPENLNRTAINGRPEVAVLIPTIDRYPYLMTLLGQLQRQTIPPVEVIVVDQTRPDRRITDLAARFPDLPLKVFVLDRPGQCSSRNLGLRDCRCEFILLLDDDVEIEPDLIRSHHDCLVRYNADVVSGVAQEIDGSSLPRDFAAFRASDVFPAGNTMVRRAALVTSGLFDLAFDRGARADADLGMRLYLSGAMAVLDPSIVVLHHHAPSGGLRAHKARKITYASSQRSLTQRHLPSPTEIYLGLRYFTAEQVREALWIRVLQTFRVRGGPPRRLARAAIGVAQLPSTLWAVARNARRARELMREFPRIGALDEWGGGTLPVGPGPVTGAVRQDAGGRR